MKTAALIVLTCGLACFAQAPAFEVASVKLADPAGSPGPRFRISPDTITIHGLSLRECIQTAWQMPPFRVTGPDWLSDVRLDIVAKASGPIEEQQLYVMFRRLIAERMGLRAHVERKEVPIYSLTVMKSGLKFSESATEGPVAMTRDAKGPLMQRISMPEFVQALGKDAFDRPVIDATGLKGRYDIHVNMTPYMPAPPPDGLPVTPMDRTTIMITVLREELGLKVEAGKGPVDMLIVERAEKTPTEN